MVPAISALLERARKARIVVGYGTRAPTMSKWLPQVEPGADDIKIISVGQDRFFKTDLENALKAKGITTLILTGWKVSGGIAYTSVGATLRDFTNVIPVDASLAATDYETTIGQYNILNQNSSNLTNEPLKPKASTLSRTDLIKFE
jgi:isochorismate hydrolase